ncbi:MAG TPA: hypothetical protein VEV17_03630 [Bryobacteraceae bacterium]|nr:hypothetical protein [Bryobacteraceae bacterium]
MRRVVLVLSIGLLAGLPVLAQRGGGHGGGGMRGGGGGGMRGGGMGGMRGGFGGGGFRGGGGFGRGFGGFRGGFRGNFGFRNFNRFGFFSPFGFGAPLFLGGFGFDDWPLDYSYPYNYSGYPPYGGYQSGQPQVIIVQQTPNAYSYVQPEPATPVVREYVSPEPSQTSYEPPLYLIAFQDASIRAVLAYWTESSTLHYVSMDHEQKQAPLASVDRALSERLNRERNVPFRLPSPPPAR